MEIPALDFSVKLAQTNEEEQEKEEHCPKEQKSTNPEALRVAEWAQETRATKEEKGLEIGMIA